MGTQPGQESERDERRRVGQFQFPQRQQHEQEQCGERGVERRNPELRSHDLAEGLAQQADAFATVPAPGLRASPGWRTAARGTDEQPT